MEKKILITGVSGFVGSHLLEHLLNKGYKNIYGTYNSDKGLANLENKKSTIKLTKIDLKNKSDVLSLIKNTKPEIIYHLAASTSPAESFSAPEETMLNNISSELNIFEAMREAELKKCRILITSSAEVYGIVEKNDLPIDEDTPLNPTNPYAVSKIAQDFLARQYFLSYNLRAIRVRPFNHIGARQSPNFVVASFAKKIAEIEKGKREPIFPVGNLEAKRDFTDVRDMVRAYDLLMEKGLDGEVYNIGSGVSQKIEKILNMLLSLSSIKVTLQSDKSLLRPIDNPDLVCDYSKINKLTGWEPEIPIEKTLKDTLDYWRNII